MKLYIQNKLQACKTCNDLPNMYYRVNYEYGTTWSVNENNSDRLYKGNSDHQNLSDKR